jgi:hypothetical protein
METTAIETINDIESFLKKAIIYLKPSDSNLDENTTLLFKAHFVTVSKTEYMPCIFSFTHQYENTACSVGTALISEWLKQKAEKVTLQQSLTNRYLLQLQDAIESLWYRLDNIKNKGGRQIMQDSYYEESTLYALASVLAYSRIYLFDGVYSQIERLESGFGILLVLQSLNTTSTIHGKKDVKSSKSTITKYNLNLEFFILDYATSFFIHQVLIFDHNFAVVDILIAT